MPQQRKRQAGQEDKNPAPDAEVDVKPALGATVPQRVDDKHTSPNADAGKEEDAGIHVDIL